MAKENAPPRRLTPSEHLLQFFTFANLPPHLAEVSELFSILANHLEIDLPPGPEKTTGLRKLLEAKDCAVRAAIPPPNITGTG